MVLKIKQNVQNVTILVITTNPNFFTVCGYGYSRLESYSHTVSRLDLPTLIQFSITLEF